MRSLLRTVPLIGALLISAATVQAFETLEGLDKATLEELDEACLETNENFLLCQGKALATSARNRVDVLCELVRQDLITTENAVKMWNKYNEAYGHPLWTQAANSVLEEYHPNCPIKTVP